MDQPKGSPQYVQTSLAASLTFGFQSGSFHRNAKLKGLNLLLRYEEGCSGRCHFCGLSRSRQEGPKGKTFIRVDWPLYSLDDIIERSKNQDQIHRVCISMITHPKALEDTLYVIRRFKEETRLFISVLITPTLIREKGPLEAMKEAGADRVGIAIDAATPQLFDQLRGKGVRGPHHWDHYWEVVRWADQVFGRYYVGIHLIVGLGETEKEMVETIQKGQDLGAPIPTSSLSSRKREAPWRKFLCLLSVNIGGFSLPAGSSTRDRGLMNRMRFDEAGDIDRFWDGYPAPHQGRRGLYDLRMSGKGWEGRLQSSLWKRKTVRTHSEFSISNPNLKISKRSRHRWEYPGRDNLDSGVCL